MRRLLPVILAVLLITAGAASASAAPKSVRLNEIQSRGTHNSTHLDPDGQPEAGVPAWSYSHRTITGQLEEQGVRQLELDVHWNWAKDDFDVYHVWFADDRATCDTLTGCLRELRAWSDDHPAHAPVLVMIEPKDANLPNPPEDGDPFTKRFDAGAFDRLDEVIRQTWTDRVITPDSVTRPGRTLRDSVTRNGWPLLEDVRQHVLFLVDGDADGSAYSGGFTSLAGRAMFVQAPDERSPVAAFVTRSGEGLPGEDKYARMKRLVGQGFMVRDLVGNPDEVPGGFSRAMQNGAHFISTDHPDKLELSADKAAPSRCNPITGSRQCTDLGIETHVPHGYEVPDDPEHSPAQIARDKIDRWVIGSAESLEALAEADPGSRTPLP